MDKLQAHNMLLSKGWTQFKDPEHGLMYRHPKRPRMAFTMKYALMEQAESESPKTLAPVVELRRKV